MFLPVKKAIKNLGRIKNPASTRLGYLRLDKNENVIGFSQEFIEMLKKEINSDFLTAYPEMDTLYGKVAQWVGCNKENIYISAGSDAAIKSVFEIFVEPSDKVIILSPTYAMFYVYAKMFQADLIEVHHRGDLSVPVEDMIEAIEHVRPKLVCIANPNSPTGTVISQDNLNEIIKVAAKQNSIVLLDEAYYLFYPVSSAGLINNYPQLIITRTFSKAFGLASARLGFACAHKDTIEYLQKVRPMYETNAFAVKFAELILDNYHLVEESVKEVRKAKEYLEGELSRLDIPHFKSHTNFILINVGSFERSIQLGKALYQRKILVKAGFGDGALKNCIRVTIGNIEQMRYFMRNFNEVLASIK